jgi:hypothetical protein
MANTINTTTQQQESNPDHPNSEDMSPEVLRSCSESVGITILLRDVCHLEVSEAGFVRSPVNSSRSTSGRSEAPSTLHSARAASCAEEPARFFAAATPGPLTPKELQSTPKIKAQKLKALRNWITSSRRISRSSSTVCCVDDSASVGHRSGVSAAATQRSRRRRHSSLLVVPVDAAAAAAQKQQHKQLLQQRNSSPDCSRTRECSPTSSTSSTCSSSRQQHSTLYERQQQLHRGMLPADALIERHSGFSNLNDWFAEVNSLSSSNIDSSSGCEDSEYDDDECCRSRRMQTDDPTFYRS